MAKEKRSKKEAPTSSAEKEKIQNALQALKGHTRPKKGEERFCRWDDKTGRLVFKDGGARKMKDLNSARSYANKNGYVLDE